MSNEETLKAKVASGEWVLMYRYYSEGGASWTYVYGTPDQNKELRAAYPDLEWAEEADERRIYCRRA